MNAPLNRSRVTGSPGEVARTAGLVRLVAPLLLVTLVAGYLLRAAWPWPSLARPLAGFLLLVLAGAGALVMAWVRRETASFIKGAVGEERVAAELAFLPAPHQVFHGVAPRTRGPASARADFDHVVVGPTGIFVIETKNWAGRIAVRDGRILCDGREPARSPLDQVKAASSRLAAGLREGGCEPGEIHAVLCFAGGPVEGGVKGVEGVVVCGREALNRVILEWTETPLGDAAQDAAANLLREWMGARPGA